MQTHVIQQNPKLKGLKETKISFHVFKVLYNSKGSKIVLKNLIFNIFGGGRLTSV